jgi:Leucine-rich repeat (LRR) protein
MKQLFVLICLLTLPLFGFSQMLSSEELQEAYVFKSIEEALKKPDEVYVLKIKVKNGIIPPEVFTFKNLNHLEMRSGKITELPPEIAQLTNLQKLDLAKNKLSGIPFVIFDMPQLIALFLGQNPITQVPDAISNLDQLEYLDLWGTEVPKLPMSIKDMSSLREIDMRMIEISREEQKFWHEYLPDVKFHFSTPCDCR